jgi:hypothetical protein
MVSVTLRWVQSLRPTEGPQLICLLRRSAQSSILSQIETRFSSRPAHILVPVQTPLGWLTCKTVVNHTGKCQADVGVILLISTRVTRLEYISGHWLTRMRLFMVFLSPFK